MISLFHALMYVINEISTPVWQNEVRQIARQVVEAMREAEKNKLSLAQKYHQPTSKVSVAQ